MVELGSGWELMDQRDRMIDMDGEFGGRGCSSTAEEEVRTLRPPYSLRASELTG